MTRAALIATVSGTLSGGRVDLSAPDWREIDIADLARGLANIRRWQGQAHRQVSVAEHSLLVGRLVAPGWRLAALLHDGHEALTGDVAAPFLAALYGREPALREAVDSILLPLDCAVARQVLATFGPATFPDSEEVEARRLAYEMRQLAVRRADIAARDIELVAMGRSEAVIGSCFALLPAREPDPLSLASQWIESVRAACAARYAGAGR